jgi:myo-inositol-1(or 4)-monophosphatase
MSRAEDLRRIQAGLEEARKVVDQFTPGEVEHRLKEGGDPVTDADVAINEALQRLLPQPGEGWLSEETADSDERLTRDRLWVVDPLDGTKEFVGGIPEWCISVGLVEGGQAVAGGICIPALEMIVLGAVGEGVSVDGAPSGVRPLDRLDGVEILASRSEVKRGEWERFRSAPFEVRPMGSVAAKMALVAAGRADATWTLVPKHEWDVAAGTALVLAAGGDVWTLDGGTPRFNRRRPLFDGLYAAPAGLRASIEDYFSRTPAGDD